MGFQSLEIARSGMAVNERALTVSSHNIANLNTKGFSRQQAIMEDSAYGKILGNQFQVGTGASLQETRQIRDDFLDSMYREESMALGYWEMRKKGYTDVENVLGEPMSSGLQEVSNKFWDSWQELSKDPSSLTARSLVRQRSGDFVEQLNYLGQQLTKLQSDLDDEIAVNISNINDYTKKISKLNIEILKSEATRDNANDFRDERNLLIDNIKKLCNADVIEQYDGQVDIYLSGYAVVARGVNHNLYVEQTAESGIFNQIKIDYANEALPIKSGYLKGLLEARGEVFGAEDSIGNGYPNSRADIVVAIDLSQSSTLYMDKIQASVTSYMNDLERRGIDTNLRLLTYSGASVVDNQNFGSDKMGFINKVRDLSPTGDNYGLLENAVDDIVDPTQFRKDVNKYTLLFTGESLSGDENFMSNTNSNALTEKLLSNNIKTMVVAPMAYDLSGTPVDPMGLEVEAGWESIAKATGGNVFDINATRNYQDLFKEVSDFMNTDINAQISNIQMDDNIIPYAFKKLNAYANIMLREINYLHSSGRTFGSTSGQANDFFVSINSAYPLKIGNIALNPNLSDVNQISASATDAQGDNTIAVGISNLRHAILFKDSKGDMNGDEFYQMFLMESGTKSGEATGITDNQQKLVDSADNYRQGIMNVSLDEEMTMVLKYKFAYNASSKALNLVDQMMDQIINRMGTVGR